MIAAWASVVSRLAQIQIAEGSRYRAGPNASRSGGSTRGAAWLDPRSRGPRARGLGRDGLDLRHPRRGRRRAQSRALAGRRARPGRARGARKAQLGKGLRLDSPANRARETAAKVKALKLRGIHLVSEPKRFYPKAHLGSTVLGFVKETERHHSRSRAGWRAACSTTDKALDAPGAALAKEARPRAAACRGRGCPALTRRRRATQGSPYASRRQRVARRPAPPAGSDPQPGASKREGGQKAAFSASLGPQDDCRQSPIPGVTGFYRQIRRDL